MAKRIEFEGHNGRSYSGLLISRKRGMFQIVYTVPGVGQIKTNVLPEDRNRITVQRKERR